MTGDLTETLTAMLGEHVMGNKWIPADEHDCRLVCFDDQPCGCTHLLMICTADGCDWTGRPDGTQGEAHRAHVAAVLAALVTDLQREAWDEGTAYMRQHHGQYPSVTEQANPYPAPDYCTTHPAVGREICGCPKEGA